MNRIIRRIKTVWLELVVAKLHCVGHVPCHSYRRFFYRLFGMKIGKGSTLHMHARFYNPSNISIGEDTIVGEDAVLDGRDKLTIGNHVDIGDYVFIGPRAIILPGVTIKKGAVVGAGAVVTKDVEEGSIVGGVPAKEIGKRDINNLNYKLGRAAWFR